MFNYKKVYMVGIKGVGMTSLAILLKMKQHNVSGSDIDEIFPTDEDLKKYEIPVYTPFNKDHITDDIDIVITTGAHGGVNNEEVIEAKRKHIPVLTHAEAVGEVMEDFKYRIAVCGSHGKTTTTSLLHHVLEYLGTHPAGIIGAPKKDYQPVENNYIVIEADEYVASPPVDLTPRFMYLNPNIIIATNVDFDHPDVYRDLNHIKETFALFFKKLPADGLLITSEDRELQSVVSSNNLSTQTYGFSLENDLVLSRGVVENNKTVFNAVYKDKNLGTFKIPLFGDHNVLNAGAIILYSINAQFDLEKVKEGLANFKGSKRRFELVFENEHAVLYDDYGHHPKEIEVTIEAFKKKYPHRRLIVIFQSHTLSRTQELKKEFIQSLSKADYAIWTDIFLSAREQDQQDTISHQIEKDAQEQGISNIHYISLPALISSLETIIRPQDVVVTQGAGNLYNHHSGIIELIKKLK